MRKRYLILGGTVATGLVLVARSASAASPSVARAGSEATGGASGQGGSAPGATAPSGAYEPPPPPPTPAPLPAPPTPSGLGSQIANGGKALAAVLAWTPFAPISLVVGPLAGVFGIWAEENEKAQVAQKYLAEVHVLALRQAEYEGYMAEWLVGDELWRVGMLHEARTHFDNAAGAAAARRLEVAQALDALEVSSYRVWMGKPRGLLKSDREHLVYGWLVGDAGITGWPLEEGDGGWSYQHEADGLTRRYHWRVGHPDYEGTVVPRLSPAQVAMQRDAALERARRATVEAVVGYTPGGYVNEFKRGLDRQLGFDERLEADLAEREEAQQPPPQAWADAAVLTWLQAQWRALVALEMNEAERAYWPKQVREWLGQGVSVAEAQRRVVAALANSPNYLFKPVTTSPPPPAPPPAPPTPPPPPPAPAPTPPPPPPPQFYKGTRLELEDFGGTEDEAS